MMVHITRRLDPPEGVKTKLGDIVTFEVVFDDGSKGTLSTVITEFDLAFQCSDMSGRVDITS